MTVLLPIIYAALFLFALHKVPFFRLQQVPNSWLKGAFLLKVAAGTTLWAIYTYYYTDRSNADIYKYFDDSKVMFDALLTNPIDYCKMLFGIANDSPYFDANYYTKMNHWYREFESNIYNDSHTIIRFNAFVRLFSFGNYHVHTVFMCFVSLTGLVALYKALVRFVKGKEKLLALVVFFVPSVVLWSSGVLKEGLVFFGLGMVLYYFFELSEKRFSWHGMVLTFFSIWLLLILKFYVLMALLPGLIGYLLVRQWPKYALLKYMLLLAGFTLVAINMHYLFPQYDLLYILSRKQLDYIGLVQEWQPGSAIEVTPLTPHFSSFLKNIPEALNNTFLRPYPWNWSNPLILVSALENLCILLCCILAFVFARPLRQWNTNLLLFGFTYVLILYTLIGWITPVLGSIVRYKIPAVPILLFCCILIIDWHKFSNKLPFLNNHS